MCEMARIVREREPDPRAGPDGLVSVLQKDPDS